MVQFAHTHTHTCTYMHTQAHTCTHTHTHSLLLCNLNGGDLLCHDRQHLNVDPVELIQACPRTGTGEPLEELSHGHEVKLVGAVEHYTLNGHRLSKILGEKGRRNG